jgi:hypothetical protein
MTDEPGKTPPRLTWPEFTVLWREIDRRVAAGEFSPAQAVLAARHAGLIASSAPYLPHEVRSVMTFFTDRFLEPFGPWLMVSFEGDPIPRVNCPYVDLRRGGR